MEFDDEIFRSILQEDVPAAPQLRFEIALITLEGGPVGPKLVDGADGGDREKYVGLTLVLASNAIQRD